MLQLGASLIPFFQSEEGQGFHPARLTFELLEESEAKNQVEPKSLKGEPLF